MNFSCDHKHYAFAHLYHLINVNIIIHVNFVFVSNIKYNNQTQIHYPPYQQVNFDRIIFIHALFCKY